MTSEDPDRAEHDDAPDRVGEGWPDLPPLDEELVVPDDASALTLEAQEWRREQRAASRSARVEKLFATRRYRERGLSGPLVAFVLVVVAAFGAMLTLLGPTGSGAPAPAPLATSGTSPVGTVGGLLPKTTLDLGSGPGLESRLVRPAVVVLPPVGCTDCAEAVRAVARQAAEFRLRSLLVAPRALTGDEPAAFQELVRASASGLAIPAIDTDGAIARAYAANGVTVVLVAADGRVSHVVRQVTADARLEALMAQIAFPDEAS